MTHVTRTTIDLGDHPDLVVIYLGMPVRTLRRTQTLRSIGKEIERAGAAQPDGLLRHEMLWYSLVPPHPGMRQYWRDLDALERWARSLPHKQWWGTFVRDPRGTGFWHETYFLRGGIEAIYDDMPAPLGVLAFTHRDTGDRGPVLRSPTGRARRVGTRSHRPRSRTRKPTHAREVPSSQPSRSRPRPDHTPGPR
jgi:hypothetical protein